MPPKALPGSRLDFQLNLDTAWSLPCPTTRGWYGNFWNALSVFTLLIGIMMIGSMMIHTAHADTPITKQQAKKFYTDCARNNLALQALTPLQRDYFCSCTALRMEKFLSVEDIQNFSNQKTPAGRAALVKMLEHVQFPCIVRPLGDNIRNECTRRAAQNPQFAATAPKYCGCLTNTMMTYVEKVGIAETLYRIKMTGEIRDPMEALLSGSGYSNELIRNYYSCFGGVLP